MTLPVPTEDIEQAIFCQWLELVGLKHTAVPNSTYTTSWKQKAKNKRTGLHAGFPDLIVLIPPARAKYGEGMLVAVEMKRTKGGVVSPDQREWIDALNSLNPTIAATVAKGAEAAIAQIQALMKEGK